jgi:DNA polymerase-3 subunit delta
MMSSEIAKLTLFTSGRRIEEEDVNAIASYDQQNDVFAMIDAIFAFNASLERLLQSGVAPAYLLFRLSRQVQRIIRAKGLSEQRKTKIEIQNRLGLTSEFALRKTLEQASRYSLSRLKSVHHRLLDTDLSIKTGRYKPELALNILIAELCQRDRTLVT